MHSRKGIFSKGIVFAISVFAMAIFSFIKVEAAESCVVSFKDNDQYLTIGGDYSSWSDSGLQLTGDNCSNISIDSLSVNGSVISEKVFTTSDKSSGSYTIAYNYSYIDNGDTKQGTIYRYLRILNSSYDTSKNYTLASFDFESSSSVIASYNISDNYFANFVVSNGSTYIVVKDSLGRGNTKTEVTYSTKSLVASKVLKNGNNYYIIGNNSEGKGALVIYAISSASSVSYSSSQGKDNVTYNGGYVDNDSIYLVGKDSNGYPLIDVVSSGTLSNLYTYSVKGEYNGITIVNGEIYAVGYTKADNVSISSGLYTYCSSNCSSSDSYVSLSILGDSANTIFNDITYNSITKKNIIVGSSAINQIYANNVLTATNTRQGYSDGIILQVSLDGTNITGAHMLGGNTDDTFTQILNLDNQRYVVVGEMNNGSASLVYLLDKTSFEVQTSSVSSSSNYKINGVVSYDYGYVYYGELKSNYILDVYYPKTIEEGNSDALFISLDNRTFSSYETISLVANTEAKYCDYTVLFNNSDYSSKECDGNNASIDTNVIGDGILKLEYVIDANTGVIIYIYRLVNVTSAPTPINLSSGTTGILRWYVYNRSYTYIADRGATRLDTTNFDYRFTGNHSGETIEDMIDYYFENGNTNAYSLSYVSNSANEHQTFINSNQTNAAFSTLENAKKFAYYQEFSRVVRVDGSSGVTVSSLGATRYGSQIINDGSSFYIYYIDYKGSNSTDLVTQCSVTANSITNCSGKGGYAFATLDSLKQVIELFLQYNNYFVSTRNTIYNGSVEASEIERYSEDLVTKEYLTSVGFSVNNNLTFNVETLDGTSLYKGAGKNVYFGGSISGTSYTHSQVSTTQTVSEYVVNGVKHYENANYVFFSENLCYQVYYSYESNNAEGKRIFCLDTTAPIITYKKDSSDSESSQSSTASLGTVASNPMFIESDFTITGLIDLDDYAFIYVNGNRYPITCNGSESCLANVDKYIKQTFKYNKNNSMGVMSISFSDRLSNVNTFYFVIGTLAPTITTENETNDGFTLVIDFYETNPITGIAASVAQQICSGETSVSCYSPSTTDTTSITNSLNDFNEALLNYIYAIGYRDNNRDDEAILTIRAIDGTYLINGIQYVINDGYLVEYQGYEESYGIDDENTFTYNETKYYYDSLAKVIRTMMLDDEVYVVNNDVAAIAIVDNRFKFSEDGKYYEIVETDNGLAVEAVAQEYEIYNSNLFELDDIIYTINYSSNTISYSNPEISTMKHIELNFTRTTATVAGVIIGGGVDIPTTTRVIDSNSKEVSDSKTGLPAYEIVEESYQHFNLVDGVYTFTISQGFNPYTSSVETKLNVKPLEMNLGIAINHNKLEVVEGKLFDYENDTDTSTSVALLALTDNFKYPLASSIVSSSNLSTYENTYFVNKTVYASYQVSSTGVFRIKVYDTKNAYGLPSTDNSTLCKEIIIYGDAYGEESPISEENRGCSDSIAIPFDSTSSNSDILAELGIYHVFNTTGSFAFNGENKFYSISLRTYSLDNNGQYQPSAVTISKTFYIDSISPIDNTNEGTTLNPYIYNNEGKINDTYFSFDSEDNSYKLSATIGANSNVGFEINWYNGTSNDYRENKLLLMSILTEEESITCNVYQLIVNNDYDTKCKEYIDTSESYSKTDSSMIVFSATGNYEITFQDASGNGITYVFSIDKTAPVVNLTSAVMNVDGSSKIISFDESNSNGKLVYYLLSYVKNPTFNIELVDLSPVDRYCYYFDYGQASSSRVISCISGSDTTYTFSMSDYTVGGKSIDEYFASEKLDQNVTLVIWAIDSLNNGNEDDATRILFWIDYKTPEVTFTKENLNEDKVNSDDVDPVRNNTITIYSDGENGYSGKTFECSSNGFSFNDSRYANGDVLYTFIVNCSDTHSANSSEYPNTYNFTNNMYMRFYEVNEDGKTKGELFNFGLPTTNGNARLIYITVVDSVGNESDNYIILPILVLDSIAPYVESAQKATDESNTFVNLTPVQYSYPGGSNSLVYLANTTIRINFNEPIAKISSCTMTLANRETTISSGACDEYVNGKEYTYSALKQTFDFTNDEDNTYKIIVLVVNDFAGSPSGNIVIVIDRIAPTVEFNEGGEKDDTIEYVVSSKAYDNQYASSGYREHIDASDDQEAGFTVTVNYAIYSPSLTYKNYIYSKNTYVLVDDYTTRKNITYYILVKQDALVNKKCVATVDKGGVTYCYVEDSQGSYYFDSLLSSELEGIWKSVSSINSTTVGVYRISYTVTDYAGNVSRTIYKKVFVNDTQNPDIDIYDDTSTLYSSVASENPDNFEGKLNKVVSFKGTDTAIDTNTKLVLYTCDTSKYKDGKCDIDYDLFTTNTEAIQKASTNNTLSLGKNLTSGIYKLFVYDTGKYVSLDTSSVYASLDGSEKIYSLTHNTSYVYFAISMDRIDAKYVINGNKYTSDYQSGNTYYTYKYSDTNYYTITNGNKATDVYLVRYDAASQKYVDISANNAIGYAYVELEYDVNENNVKFIYKDLQGRVVYEVNYEKYTGESLLLHETYHNINISQKTVDICKIVNGENQCIGNTVYKIVSVTANIYEDGEYILQMVDRYGNYSQDVTSLVVDNTPYTYNKDNNSPTGINYWYSVPSVAITSSNSSYLEQLVGVDNDSDINVLDSKYTGNFNSNFFYAFASKDEAKAYLTTIYSAEISKQLQTGSYVFYGIDGSVIRTYNKGDMTEAEILASISSSLSKMIFTTYTQNRNFSDSEIRQVAYTGASNSMYKYTYLLVTTTITNGHVGHTYTLKGDTCTVTDTNQECVKVELKIVSANNTSINLESESSTNTIICRVSGTGGSSELSGSACNFATVTSGATYVFIDSDVNSYHTNTVYYGITAYSENADVVYSEIGSYIPLEKFDRYTNQGANSYVKDDNGNYIWLNSKYVLLNSIITTNLYKNSCTFNSQEYSECIYASYVSRFSRDVNGKYIPSASGSYYYNYYNDTYYNDKDELMTSLGVDSTYNSDGKKCDDKSCQYVPIRISSTTINASLTTSVVRQTNKKTYIELFNETTTSKLFEINTIKVDNIYSEVYSYAILSINGTYYNINNFIVISSDRTTYRCVIDIDLESTYNIVIIDRAGNQLNINFSHSSITPSVSYELTSEATTSNAIISISTSSKIAKILDSDISVYKYSNNAYASFSNTSCLEISSQAQSSFNLEFKYSSYANCQGIYKVVVVDSHGNSNYKEFVFNPYNMETHYTLDESNNIYEYAESNINGVIINKVLRVDVDTSLNYLVINKYAAYSNLNLASPKASVTITDFTSDSIIDSCRVIINRFDGDIYSVYINGASDHSCDGIYTIDLVNKFSKEVIDLGFTNLEGASNEEIVYRVTYGDSSTIEVDTTAPNTEVMDSLTEQYFSISIDDENPNYTDTKTLIENKEISYTNKYITVAWGGYQDYSLTYLKYRIKRVSDSFEGTWSYEKTNVTYNKDYQASYKFIINEPDVYICEFMFTDAVGNENANDIFRVIITIEAPNVGFFEVNENATVIGNQYESGQRIAERTILRCIYKEGSADLTRACTTDDYNYRMRVNNVEYSAFSDDLELADIISRNSYWIRGTAAQYAEELIITLTVSVKGKADIKTDLLIVIDKKAPVITINGVTIGSTYTTTVSVEISNDDSSNYATIYKCDSIIDDTCMLYDSNNNLIEGKKEFMNIDSGSNLTATIDNSNSGYFMVIAKDDLGNTSSKWFTLDNEAPTITVSTGNSSVAPNMYTNANAVYVTINDALSSQGSTFAIEFTPYNSEDPTEIVYDNLVGLTKEGKYTLTPKDGVNNEGRSITFYIYRQSPKYTITTNNGDDTHVVNSEVTLSWQKSDSELVAPIVSVTVDGKMYNATYNSTTKKYTGEKITSVGEHTFVITDSAGNRSVIMITINNSSQVCINGIKVEVKMQAYYNVDSLLIGNEAGVTYAKDDVVIFALPSQVSGSDCVSEGLLGYRTLDPSNSNYLIDSDRNATLFNNNKFDFVAYGFISEAAINEINNVGGTVMVFVVTKDVANKQLGYSVGTNFFSEDPIGWSMIFAAALCMVWPVCRIFIKKKVRVI